MTIPDYTHSAEDHRTLLILVKQIGEQITQKAFSKIFDKITRIQQVRIQDTSGERIIWLRYKKHYPPENNDWGDFQTHRKVLGLLSVGKSNNQSDIDELWTEHNTLQEHYSGTLYDSRCLVFGADSSSPSSNDSCKLSNEHLAASPEQTQSPALENSQTNVFRNEVDLVPKSHLCCDENGPFEQPHSIQEGDSLPSIGNFEPSEMTITTDAKIGNEPNINVTKNLQLCNSHGNSPLPDVSSSSSSSSPTSPASDDNSSSSEKVIIAPSVKTRSTHCIVYPSVDDCTSLEQDIDDFINSLFWVLESKRLDRSFEKQEKIPLLTASFEKKDFVGIDTDTRVYKKRCLGRMKKHIGDLALQAGLPLEAMVLYSSAYELLKSVHDWLWLASTYEGQCSATISLVYPSPSRNQPLQRNSSFPVGVPPLKAKTSLNNHSRSLPNGIDPAEFKNLGKNVLSVEDIVEKFNEAVNHYQKYHNAAVIELECSIKATKFLISHERYLEASDFLQNVVFTSLSQNDTEKMHRFDALSQLYMDMGFHRKAAFFKRIAAMRSVSQSNPNPNWTQCYHFLLQALDGFKLSLDPREFPKDIIYGWPGIQIQILRDLVGVAKHMNNQALAVRHMTFLLHTLSQYLTSSEQRDFCSQLESLTTKCEGAPVPLALDNGFIIPPVNLLSLPHVKSFKLQNLAPHLRPVKMVSQQTKLEPDPRESIFIFSPMPRDRDRLSKDTNKLNFKWVEGDVCEVALQVFNPLTFELKVTHMGLLADSIAFESFPACLSLPAESGPYPVNLLGTPLGTGELQILGYTTHVLGVKSNCRLRDIPAIKRPFFAIEVIPKLPLVQVATSLPKASTFSSLGDTSYVVMSAAVTMYCGESHECTITITNVGIEPVERIDLSLHSKLDKVKQASFFTWSKENLDTQLPIAAGCAASLTLYINALGEFVNPVKTQLEASTVNQSNKGSRSSSTSSLTGTPNRRKPPVVSPEPFAPKIVEAVLQIQYTGGPGMVAEYCRQCAVAITVEILPSITITKWDVLPAEVPGHCYLVLDMLNSTAHEMELQYAPNKRILIEGHDTCRIPVPVERCPLSIPPLPQDEVLVTSDMQRKQSLILACREHLVNLVDLQWILHGGLIGTEMNGRASISEITWTDAMLDVILMSPIQWDILLNGRLFKVEDEFNFMVGDQVTLSITLRNMSDITLHSLRLYIRGYQDHQNGYLNYRLETKRAVIGSDKIFIKEILPRENYYHECGFIFFHTGTYKLDIVCSSKDHQGIWPHMSSKFISRSARSSEKGDPLPSIRTCDSESHVWKCSPSIEITIIEE